MNKNFLLAIACVLSLNVNFAQAHTSSVETQTDAPAQTQTYVSLISFFVDETGKPVAFDKVLNIDTLSHQYADIKEMVRKLEEAREKELELSFTNGLGQMFSGIKVMLIVADKKARPVLIDLRDKVIVPCSKKLWAKIVELCRMGKEKAFSLILPFDKPIDIDFN